MINWTQELRRNTCIWVGRLGELVVAEIHCDAFLYPNVDVCQLYWFLPAVDDYDESDMSPSVDTLRKAADKRLNDFLTTTGLEACNS